MHDTKYTIFFAVAVCFVCSIFVAGSAVLLKDRQEANALLDQQKKVLSVADLLEEGEKLSPAEVNALFEKNIQSVVVNLATGAVASDIDATAFDQKKAAMDTATSEAAPENGAKVRRIPHHGLVYRVVVDDELTAIIFPIEGAGLWGTLYGYIAIAPDLKTVKGITFYKHKETPGLGGEVDNPRWKNLWVGRQAFDDRGRVALSVKKGQAGSVEEDPYQVDGLSGATLTSRGVTHTLEFWLGDQGFGPYITAARNGGSM
ncbi:MAG: Na(+)-translocating NADH-quinone reductase subunit C [Deltaproteobacteria bacterium]|nr:Na(+)-translocating NADH-quinone reductase subunit C [Deltaproteobacteria bacterium]